MALSLFKCHFVKIKRTFEDVLIFTKGRVDRVKILFRRWLNLAPLQLTYRTSRTDNGETSLQSILCLSVRNCVIHFETNFNEVCNEGEHLI